MMLTQAEVHWIVVDQVDSSNSALLEHCRHNPWTGIVAMLAHRQTGGRGRAGRVWHSAAGQSLCLSIALPMAGSALPCLPLCAGIGVAQGLASLGVQSQLKWPNDILIDGAKVGGILCEATDTACGPAVVVGIGINIGAVPEQPTAAPSSSTAPLPRTSLQAHWPLNKPMPEAQTLAERLLPCVVSAIEAALNGQQASLMAQFNARDVFRGQVVQVWDGPDLHLEGKAWGVGTEGTYLIETAHGLQTVLVGDLSLRSLP